MYLTRFGVMICKLDLSVIERIKGMKEEDYVLKEIAKYPQSGLNVIRHAKSLSHVSYNEKSDD